MAYIDDAFEPMDNTRATPMYEAPDVPAERSALVKKLTDQVKDAQRYWSKQYARMRKCMRFASGMHWPNQREGDERMIVDITQRHVQSRTAALYAKNPTIVAQRKKRLEFANWDGTPEELMALAEKLQQNPEDPILNQALRSIQEGLARRKMLTKLGKTLEILFEYSLDEQFPLFKDQAKDMIPRILTCGVGYMEIDYQRETQKRPDIAAKLGEVEGQIATLERLQLELQKGELDTYSSEIEVARSIMATLSQEPEIVTREGLVVAFPQATRVIPDKKTRKLSGWLGSDWVAVMDPMSKDDIQETYGVDIGDKAAAYAVTTEGELRVARDGDDPMKAMCCVYRIYHRKHGVMYVVCDGYNDFLQPPAAPNVKVEGFVPLIAVVFNRQEAENDPFPKSDVHHLMPLQKEINRLAESLRQARIAAKPRYVSMPGALDEDEKLKLSSLPAHSVLELKAIHGNKIEEVIQQLKVANIDPNLYTPDPVYDAIMRVVGSQEANFGGTSNSTATEVATAEASRVSSLDSNTDDLDEALTLFSRMAGQVLLANMTFETVQKVVGPGAIWPQFSARDIAEEMFLTIQAGSTGRPNKTQELANLERVTPLLVQLPGVKLQTVARMIWEALDSKIDFEEFFDGLMPSITAMNSQAQPGTGDPSTDPNAQGGEGGNRIARPDQAAGGPQAALPAPSEGVDNGGQQY
jgi:hypothetical protein